MLGPEYRFGVIARLADFRPLLPAEEDVVAGLPNGDFDRLGDGERPREPDEDRVIRAHFLRFLLLGGDDDCRPHEKGIRLSGAWIAGPLDLEACRVLRDIGLNNCRFDTAPNLNSAVIERLFLDGSSLPGLSAERLEARGGLYLRGAEVDGEVRLISATFGGNTECDGATFRPVSGPSLNAEGIEARRIHLRGARCSGPVILTGAELDADLDCAGMTLTATGDVAINAGAIDVGGSVVLRAAAVDGEVRLLAARIGGDLDCSGLRIVNPGRDGLQLSRAAIAGAFFLRDGAAIDGTLAMTGATIGSIHDEASSWPKQGDLLLNRCLYSAFIGGPVDAESRLDWLSRQSPERWGEDFWPQPYEQLASVLQEMGHEEDARTVLIAKEGLQRAARRKRATSPLARGVMAAMDGILKVTVAYGRQPLLAFVWLVFFWLLGVIVFGYAESLGAFRPSSPVVLRQAEWTLCGVPKTEQRELAATGQLANGRAEPGQNQLSCFRHQWEAASFPVFSPWMYSLDNLLPVLDLEQTVVIRTSWPALVAHAESAIPTCHALAADHGSCANPVDGMILQPDDWFPLGRNWLGRPLGAKGNAWREKPLSVSLSEDQMAIALSVFYRVRVGTMDGRRELASCGIDEPPREIIASLAGNVRLAPEWHLDPSLVAAIDPANDCTATMLKVNLSDRFAEPLNQKLQGEADAVEARVRQVTVFREKAAALWAKASEPIDFGRVTWLKFNPVGVVAGSVRLTDDGQYLAITLALKARPRVALGARPEAGGTAPLPALTPGDVTPHFDLNIRGLVTYDQASRKLTEKLGGRRFSFFIFSVEVEEVRVSGSGAKVVIAVDVRGAFNGTLYLYGTPRFLAQIGSRAGGVLTFEDIDYAVETRSLLARLGQALFSDRIREALAENAQWDLTGELRSALDKVTRAVNRDLTPDATMSGRFTSFGPGTVRVGPEEIEGWYRVGGAIEIVFDPF